MEAIGLFLVFAGFIIGLGAVTVIDIHGFLGRKSSYWSEATIRTHKVTKPLIWIGMTLLILGFILLRTKGYFSESQFQTYAFVMTLMVLNGIFLSVYVSKELIKREREGRAQEILPKTLQRKIAVSFVISFFSWWGLVISTICGILYT